MFKVLDEPTFSTGVEIKVPTDKGPQTEKCKPTYRAIDAEEIEVFDLRSVKDTKAFLRRVIVRIDDLTDAKGAPLTWSEEALEAVLRLPYALNPLTVGYFDQLNGAQKGN